ncbi:neuronal acetylcholine receptor subunit alpha-3-like [Gigantopelta aegis]|uniref:neuronal acetylcholine receptor subunit alpha-3-like n=1 Tax=Gigantopelta aegis TaxID=1735272 RepID=UPI001B88A67C|nr:neuronal acetylcholine receptor subunit alpha-3-like [Gigantopelta aegis]
MASVKVGHETLQHHVVRLINVTGGIFKCVALQHHVVPLVKVTGGILIKGTVNSVTVDSEKHTGKYEITVDERFQFPDVCTNNSIIMVRAGMPGHSCPFTIATFDVGETYLITGQFIGKKDGSKWVDTRLQWSQTGNPDFFFEDDKKLWVPELMVDNSVLSLGVIRADNILLRVRYDGEVTWEPTGIFYTSCNIDISYYPFDKQKCQLEITSWAYNIGEQNLTFLGTGFNLQDFSSNAEWDLVDTTTGHRLIVEEGQTFAQLDFVFTTTRRASYYVLNIVLPIMLMSLLSVLVFLLPFQSGEKASYALTVLLSYTVLLTIVAAEMPPISNSVSILAVYLALILVIGATTTFLSVVNLYLYHQVPQKEIPHSLKQFTTKFLCKVSSWQKLDPEASKSAKNRILPELAENGQNKTNKKPKKAKAVKGAREDEEEGAFYSWVEIAYMFDVFYFRLFTVIVLIITVVFMMTLPLVGYLGT